MAILGFELEEIAQLIELVEAQELEELVVVEEERFLRIRSKRSVPSSKALAVIPSSTVRRLKQAAVPVVSRSQNLNPDALPPGHVVLKSPMVGVFYRSDKPGSPPLVKEGDVVEVGQIIGVLEAMKIFSEYKSDAAGIVAAVIVQDNALVQAGAPLFIIRTGER